MDFLKRLIDQLLASEQIDPNRIYLTGHSMGGIGSFLVPKFLKNYFAALVPMNTAGGCPEVCQEIDNSVYDNLSIWAVHHRSDDAGSNFRAVFTKLNSQGHEVHSTHSFGQEIVDLEEKRVEELIEEHQRYFHTEYRYSCKGNRFFCHTSSTDTILQDTLFQRWLFRQHRTDPEAISIMSIDPENHNTVGWKTKNPLDSVEVWFRASMDSKWLMLTKIVSGKKSFKLISSVRHSDIRLNSKVKLVAINDQNFAYGISEAAVTRIVTGIQEDHENPFILIYPNPVINTLYLKLPENISRENLSYQITSLQGSVLINGLVIENPIDVTGLPAGTYLIILRSGSRYIREKLIVMK